MVNLGFVAGFFDADGCVYISKKGFTNLSFYNDNKEVLQAIVDALGLDNNVGSRKKPRGGINYYVTISKRDVVPQLIDLLIASGCIVKREKLLKGKKSHIRYMKKPKYVRKRAPDRRQNLRDKFIKDNPEMPIPLLNRLIGGGHYYTAYFAHMREHNPLAYNEHFRKVLKFPKPLKEC